MAKQTINLTLSLLIAEIENVLDTLPADPYRHAFAIPETRQSLVAYILNRIRSLYTVKISDAQQLQPQMLLLTLEQQRQVDAIIRQGMHYLLQENAEWIDYPIASPNHVLLEASHWFG